MGVRPSELLDIDDPYVAFCFDECVVLWGLYVRSELESVGHKPTPKERANNALRKQKLDALLGTDRAAPKKFANPVATV